MPGRACLDVLARKRAGFDDGRAPQRVQRRAGCSASRVTPALTVLRAHPSSAAPSGVRWNAAGAVGVIDAVAVGLTLQGGY
jgi:hypothetical protein